MSPYRTSTHRSISCDFLTHCLGFSDHKITTQLIVFGRAESFAPGTSIHNSLAAAGRKLLQNGQPMLLVQVDVGRFPDLAEMYHVNVGTGPLADELPCMRIAATEPHEILHEGREVMSLQTVPFRPALKPYPLTEEGLLAFARAHHKGWSKHTQSLLQHPEDPIHDPIL